MLISSDMHDEEFHTIPFLVDHDQQEFGATSSGTIINWKLGLCGEHSPCSGMSEAWFRGH